MEDAKRVIKGKLWNFGGGFMMVDIWPTSGRWSDAKLMGIPCWIRVSGLPPQALNKENVLRFAGFAGEVLELPWVNTQRIMLNGYARAKVLVPASRCIFSSSYIPISGKKVWIQLKYENLPLVCFNCGHWGHYENLCNNPTVRIKNQQGTTVNLLGPWLRVDNELASYFDNRIYTENEQNVDPLDKGGGRRANQSTKQSERMNENTDATSTKQSDGSTSSQEVPGPNDASRVVLSDASQIVGTKPDATIKNGGSKATQQQNIIDLGLSGAGLNSLNLNHRDLLARPPEIQTVPSPSTTHHVYCNAKCSDEITDHIADLPLGDTGSGGKKRSLEPTQTTWEGDKRMTIRIDFQHLGGGDHISSGSPVSVKSIEEYQFNEGINGISRKRISIKDKARRKISSTSVQGDSSSVPQDSRSTTQSIQQQSTGEVFLGGGSSAISDDQLPLYPKLSADLTRQDRRKQ